MPERPTKVAVVGEIGSGKTTLCKRNESDVFIPYYSSSISVDFYHYFPKRDDEKSFQLWAIPGQERYGNLMRVYLADCSHVVLIIDPTRDVIDSQVKSWLETLEKSARVTTLNVVLVVSKSEEDLENKQGKDICEAIQRGIENADITNTINIVNKEKIIFLSAKTGENCDSWCDVLLGNNENQQEKGHQEKVGHQKRNHGMALLSVDALETHYKTSGGSAFATQSIFGLFWKNSYPEVVSKLQERAAENKGGASYATLSTFNIT